jgi:hypothetical protein
MAYEGCIQICVSQIGKSGDAQHFLRDGMKVIGGMSARVHECMNGWMNAWTNV